MANLRNHYFVMTCLPVFGRAKCIEKHYRKFRRERVSFFLFILDVHQLVRVTQLQHNIYSTGHIFEIVYSF